ncbi:glycosyltransferase [Effusibacillus consociatus]|uniref:Glycosyltransferase n=1 Tax=Effusibacillus consociatus TaxID=1117041 RepID=A0ABV9PZP4_9BACL
MARNKPLLTLCMVVKNEELLLPRCLQSVQGLVDEIIVVDTGSTDRTKEIARQAGAIVVDEPWQNDFSKPLNRALREAKGEWILRLDGDEELYQEDKAKLRKLLKNRDTEAYILQIVNLVNDRNLVEEEISSFVRLFRNRPMYRFEGVIHEQIVPSILSAHPKAVIRHAPVRIKHYGYLKEISDPKKKEERNRELTLKAIRQDPENGYLRYYMGIEYRRQNNREEAVLQFAEAMKYLDLAMPWAPRCVQAYAITLMEMRRWNEAKSILEKGIGWYPDYTDLVYLRGVVHFEQGENLDAVAAFSKCIRMGDPPETKYVVMKGMGGYKSYYALGQVYEKIGNIQQSLEAYEKSYKMFPQHIQPLYHITGHLLQLQPIHAIQQYLEAIMPFPNREKYPVIADIFLSLRQYEATEKYIKELQEDDPSFQFRYLLGGCYRKRGQYREAIQVLQQVPVTSPFYVEAQLQLCAANMYLNERDQAAEIMHNLNADEKLYGRLALLFLEDAKDVIDQGIRLFPNVPFLQKEKEKIEEAIRNVGG